MNKRFAFITVSILVFALFLGANNVGCGSAKNFTPQPDAADDVVDDNSPPDQPAASTTPYDPYYWVSTEGSDDNPGTQEKPFRTVYKAATECYMTAPKDVYIYPGTYEEAKALFFPPNVSVYGLGSRTIDPVKYRPVIDLRGCEYDHCSFFMSGSPSGSDITIDGLKIYAKGMGIWAYDTAFTLTNSEIIVSENNVDDTIGVEVNKSTYAGNVVLRDNTITTEDMTNSNRNAIGISIGTDADSIDILDNTISTGQTQRSTMAISLVNYSINNQDILIKGNTMISGNAPEFSGGIFSMDASSLRVEENVILSGDLQTTPNVSETTIGVYVHTDSAQNQANVTILNNVIYGGSGGDQAYGIWLQENVDGLILFNTIDAGSGATTETTGIFSFEGAITRAHNNILCAGTSNQSHGILGLRGGDIQLSHNLFCDDLDVFYETHPDNALPQSYTDASVLNAADVDFANNISGDPNFVDFASHDYHTVFPSDAVDAGRIVTGVTHDLEGDARMRGPAPDIGAYELR